MGLDFRVIDDTTPEKQSKQDIERQRSNEVIGQQLTSQMQASATAAAIASESQKSIEQQHRQSTATIANSVALSDKRIHDVNISNKTSKGSYDYEP